jgi:hypothetical protein
MWQKRPAPGELESTRAAILYVIYGGQHFTNNILHTCTYLAKRGAAPPPPPLYLFNA